MTTTLKVQTFAPAADVRAWAHENGLPAGSRGRFSPETIKAYNRSHAVKYREAGFVPTKAVETRDKRGKKVVRKVNVASARAVLREHGETVGTRGRLSASQLSKALALVG